MLYELRLWYVSDKFDVFVDDRFGHASDHISLRQMREFVHFNDVGHYVFILNRHLMSQPGYGWTVRSCRCDEYLNVKILV